MLCKYTVLIGAEPGYKTNQDFVTNQKREFSRTLVLNDIIKWNLGEILIWGFYLYEVNSPIYITHLKDRGLLVQLNPHGGNSKMLIKWKKIFKQK